MPFTTTGRRTVPPTLQGLPDFEEASTPAFWTETLPAAFRTENLLGSYIAEERAPTYTTEGLRQYQFDEDFDPFSELNIAGYEEHADRFVSVLTREQSQALKNNIDRETADRQVLQESGGAGFVAMMGAGLLDPTVLIPVGGQLKAGASLLNIAARVGGAAAYGTAVQEVGLLATQELRTGEEAVFNVAGAALLGGVLGSMAHPFLKSADGVRAARNVENEMRMPDEGDPDWMNPLEVTPVGEAMPAGTYSRTSSAGAEAVARPTIDQQAIQGDVARKVAETIRAQDPVLRSITSNSLVVRELVEEMADLPAGLVKNEASQVVRTLEDGTEQLYVKWGARTEQSVESAIRTRDSILGQAVTSADDHYARYLYGRDRKAGDILASGVRSVTGTLPDGKMTRPDFQEQVTRAMREGDVSDIPEVQAAAQGLRREFFDPLKDEAVELGMFGYDMVPNADPDLPPIMTPRQPTVGDTAAGYVPRVYDRQLIAARRPEFTETLFNHFVRRRDEAIEQADALETDLARSQEDAGNFRTLARQTLVRRDREIRAARQAVATAERARQRATAKKGEAGAQASAADRRVDATDFPELAPLDAAYYRGLQADVARGRGKEQGVTLLQFIRAQGGISDVADELRGLDAHRIGLMNSKSGRSVDDIALAASEEGYIGARLVDGEIERGSIDDLMEAIREEMSGGRKYSNEDIDLIEYDDMLAGLGDALVEADMDVNSISLEQFASWHAKETFRRASPFRNGKHSEALLRERFAGNRLRDADEKVENADFDLESTRIMARTLRETAPELTEQANELRKAFRRQRTQSRRLAREHGRLDSRGRREDYELRADAARTVDHIMGGAEGRLSFDGRPPRTSGVDRAPGLSGRFKARVLDIPDAEIAEFLENGLDHILRVTHRSMVPDIELTRRFGSVDMNAQITRVSEDFDQTNIDIPAVRARERRAARARDGSAEPTRTPEEQAKFDADEVTAVQRERVRLDGKKKAALRDIEGMRDRLRGTYGLPADPNGAGHRIAGFLKSFNYYRLMGGVTIASIPDLSRAVFTNGLNNAMGAPLRALSGNLSSMRGLSQELKDAGPGFEMVLNNRIMSMADLTDDFGRHTKMERAMTAGTSHFGYASLITPWNQTMKSLAGYGVQNRILRSSLGAADGTISQLDATKMAQLGIGEHDALGIAAQFRRFGRVEGGQHIANSRQWDNPALRDRWLNAIRKEVDRVIVTPGLDKPLRASSDLGGVLLQFRSYNFAATQRVMLAYLQGMSARDAHAMMALTTQIGLGMVVAKIKADQYGVDTSQWTANKWAVEGFDRAGIAGVFTDVNMMAEHLTRGNIGLSRLGGEGRLTRYQTRNLLGAWLGPSFGGARDTLSGISGLSNKAFGGEVQASDVNAMRRILPYNNLFWARERFDDIEKAAGDTLGVEE